MAKDRYEIDFSDDPVFNSVTGLSNVTFNPSDIRSGYMATEDQLFDLYNRTVTAGQDLARCCKEFLVWEAYTQIVRLHTNTLWVVNNVTLPQPNAGGVIISSFDQNRATGFMRRGEDYTITFPVSWDNNRFCPITAMSSSPSCGPYKGNNLFAYNDIVDRVSYRFRTDGHFEPYCVSTGENLRGKFFHNPLINDYSSDKLTEINNKNNWNAFTRSISGDGKISITDHRRLENFSIIRYYVQFTLNTCSDGTSLRTAIEPVIAQWNTTHPESEQLFYGP